MERLRGHTSDVNQLPARMNVQNAMGLLTLSGNVCGVKNYPIYCWRLCHWTTHHTNSLTQKHTHKLVIVCVRVYFTLFVLTQF